MVFDRNTYISTFCECFSHQGNKPEIDLKGTCHDTLFDLGIFGYTNTFFIKFVGQGSAFKIDTKTFPLPVTLFCMEIRILSQIKANYEKDQKCGKEKNSFEAFAFHRLFCSFF